MYYPIWRTTKYTSTADTLTYRIVYGEDQVIYTGKAYKMPDENRIAINLNGTCRNYLNSRIFENVSGIEELEDVVFPMSSSGDFHLEVQSGSNWDTVYSWGFVNDWTYDKSVSAITGSIPLSEPINGHASPEMLIPYTHFLSTAPEMAVCYTVLPAVDWVGSLSPESMDVPPAASSYTAVFSSNLPWTATTYCNAGETQFTMTPLTGSAGDTRLTYNFAQNESEDTVYCAINFEAYDRTGPTELNYELWQDDCIIDGEFENYSSAITVPYSATSVTFTVLSNCEWEFISLTTGITATPSMGTGDADITVSFDVNTGTAKQLSFYIQSYPNGLVTSRNFVINQGGASNNRVLYTSTDNNIVTPNNTTGWGANIVSNTYSDGQGVIEFDSSITGVPINAFNNATTLKSIIIPNSVTVLGKGALRWTSLDSVTMSVNTVYIGEGCFEHTNISSITIPNTVTGLGENCFAQTKIESIVLPNSITEIARGCFMYCQSLTSVTLPIHTTVIRSAAFGECSNLSGITIPDTVITIEDVAFADCGSLINISIPSGVTSLGNKVFQGCTNLVRIDCYATTAPTISNLTFYGVQSNKVLHYPSGSDYSTWLGTGEHYLGYYNWTGVADL